MNDDEMLRVTCLCAAWCGVCRDYRAVLDEAAAGFAGQARFAWIDIEDDAELLDDVEVENFPTLLIARGERVLFFGTIMPQPGTLARLVEGALAGELPAPVSTPAVDALAARHAAGRDTA